MGKPEWVPYVAEVRYPGVIQAYMTWRESGGDDVLSSFQIFTAGWAAAQQRDAITAPAAPAPEERT